jgi:hypothetical protein
LGSSARLGHDQLPEVGAHAPPNEDGHELADPRIVQALQLSAHELVDQ